MKKLLIAMTAAAVGTCAWAEGEQTLLNETFESTWTLAGNTWWTYSAGEAADGELTLADGKLSLNTGSKVLTGSFTSDDQPKAIGTDGLYFNATVTFKDPSDTLPTLGAQDKFALVVLDNVESIDAEKATAPATNLMVIAKYGTEAQRAYELNVAVDSAWLAGEHEIVVKAYDNVMKSGSTACAGFLVMVDETVCKVVNSYAIVDGVVDFGVFCAGNNFGDDGLGGSGNLGYLGYAKDAIAASMQLRYENAELLLSNVPGSDTLASVDFQGQGVIDDVSLATTGADFGADALVFTVEVSDGVTLTSDATVYYGAASETKNITFTLAEGYVLKAPLAAVKGDNGVYTYAYTTVADNNQVVNIEAYEPAAYIGDTAYETFAAALAVGGEITLSKAITAADANGEGGFIDIAAGQTVTIDLNGNDIVDIVNAGNLTIKDSVGTGRVLENAGISVSNEGTLTILGGYFEGAIEGATAKGISGGKFKNKTGLDEALADGLAFSAEATNDYYSVVEASTSDYPESDKLVDRGDATLTPEQEAAVEATFDAIAGEAADADAAVTNYINTVYGAKVPVNDLIGAQSVDISVAFNLPLMKTAEPIVEIVAEAVGANDAAAFSFQIEDGEGNPVAIKAAVAKVYDMIRYATDLADLDNGKVAAGNPDVECVVDEGNKKIKVNMKKTQTKGFMKVKLR